MRIIKQGHRPGEYSWVTLNEYGVKVYGVNQPDCCVVLPRVFCDCCHRLIDPVKGFLFWRPSGYGYRCIKCQFKWDEK